MYHLTNSSDHPMFLIIIQLLKEKKFKTHRHQQHDQIKAAKSTLVPSGISEHELGIKSRARRTLPPLSPCIFNSSIFRKDLEFRPCEKTASDPKSSSSRCHVWSCLAKTLLQKTHQLTSRCVKCSKTPGSIMMPNPAFCLVSPSMLRRRHIKPTSCYALSHFSPLATSKGQKGQSLR